MNKSFELARLKDISVITLGYQFREKILPISMGNISVIQMSNITDNYTLNTNNLIKTCIKEDELKEEHYLLQDDILFTPRGYKNFATLIDRPLEKTIAASHFYIIKIKEQKRITPSYLVWYINQKPAQEYFKKHAAGTRIPIINRKLLGQLIISIPDIETQIKITKIYNLSLRENFLLKEIQKKRKLFIETFLLKQLND
ncbi:MAG TPA: restriction endonuclease subunit S [Candidatus Eremiobacteraeota bacterium]|nr:MAG: Type I restriction modification DNA specificity domain protein [bacterium ADurb.Bin363]HPZ07402.1 restriction endonuclease subunit S [Candidatus Eremiobacteraeota bacterium]